MRWITHAGYVIPPVQGERVGDILYNKERRYTWFEKLIKRLNKTMKL